jgi:hypothetical protein
MAYSTTGKLRVTTTGRNFSPGIVISLQIFLLSLADGENGHEKAIRHSCRDHIVTFWEPFRFSPKSSSKTNI